MCPRIDVDMTILPCTGPASVMHRPCREPAPVRASILPHREVARRDGRGGSPRLLRHRPEQQYHLSVSATHPVGHQVRGPHLVRQRLPKCAGRGDRAGGQAAGRERQYRRHGVAVECAEVVPTPTVTRGLMSIYLTKSWL